MTSFIELPLILQNAQLKAECYAKMEEQFPGWRPDPGNPEKWFIDAMIDRLTVPLSQLAADVAAELFNQYGQQIVKVMPIEATPAKVASTWRVKDKAGYEIPAGTQVLVPTSGNTAEGFRVVNTVVVPKESEATEAGQVLLEALEPGSAANHLSGEARLESTLELLAPEEGITLVGETEGGEDAEEPEAFLSRLAETMETLAPRPIIPRDAAILARNIPGVHRSVALDMFNPEIDNPNEPATWLSERTLSVVVCDVAGEPCTEAVKLAVEEDLQSKREVNFIFFVLDPTYTVIKVKWSVVPLPGYDKAAVNETLSAAFLAALSPANFGSDPTTDERSWLRREKLFYQDLITVGNNQQGVDHFTELKIGKEGGAYGEADIALTGPAALTRAGKLEPAA
jgi:hypothetical protein